MTIVKELNKLAEKITGTNPRATTDKKALDFIGDYFAEQNLSPKTNAQAVKNITDNYQTPTEKTTSQVIGTLYNSTNTRIYMASLGVISDDNIATIFTNLVLGQLGETGIIMLLIGQISGYYLLKNKGDGLLNAYNVNTLEEITLQYNYSTQELTMVE